MRFLAPALAAALLALAGLSLSLGKFHVEPYSVVRILASKVVQVERDWEPQAETVVLSIRLPRVLGAALVGAGLAFSSAILQAMFRNPLVSPFILGISSGAGFGACAAILLGLGRAGLHASVFAGGVAAVTLTCLLGGNGGGGSRIPLVLAGIIVGGFFGSLVSILHYVADPYTRLPEMVYWTMGSLARVTMEDLAWAAPVILVCGMGLHLHRWRLNILSLGDAEALALGEDASRLRLVVIVLTTLLVAVTVTLAGVVGWVGLVVANVARLVVGPDMRRLLPVCALGGALYMLAIDDLCRTLAPVEIPLGILTSLVGAPAFVAILQGMRRDAGDGGR